jgi:uncharacterized DUF497 family protein
MEELEFEWDAEKAWANARKHGVTFAEGATVFGDRLARLMAERMIHGEDRQVIVGLSAPGRLLVFVFVDRGRIRIISTRRATPYERHEHEEAGR